MGSGLRVKASEFVGGASGMENLIVTHGYDNEAMCAQCRAFRM